MLGLGRQVGKGYGNTFLEEYLFNHTSNFGTPEIIIFLRLPPTNLGYPTTMNSLFQPWTLHALRISRLRHRPLGRVPLHYGTLEQLGRGTFTNPSIGKQAVQQRGFATPSLSYAEGPKEVCDFYSLRISIRTISPNVAKLRRDYTEVLKSVEMWLGFSYGEYERMCTTKNPNLILRNYWSLHTLTCTDYL